MQPPYESSNSAVRTGMRGAAIILLPIGAVFLGIGVIDFLGSFGGHGFPTKFWCAFIGIPMLSIGMFCFKAGFLRSISGYVAGETAPVVRDTARYVTDGLRPAMRESAAGEGKPARENDPIQRLRKLDAMKAEGLVSEAEYTAKRASILEDL